MANKNAYERYPYALFTLKYFVFRKNEKDDSRHTYPEG